MNTRVFSPGDGDRLITLTNARDLIGVSRSKLYELMAADEFPLPVKIGRRTHFSEREVQAWIADRLAMRSGNTGAQHGRR